MKHERLSKQVIGAAYRVYNTLGCGFLEKVYLKAMLIELRKSGISCQPEAPLKVWYEGQLVGDYFADIIVDNTIILELKAVSAITTAHEMQLVNYLKATGIEIGLLINFGPKIEIKRKIFEKDYRREKERIT